MKIWYCLHRTEKVIFQYVLWAVCLLQIPRQGKKQNQHLLNACRWWISLLSDFCSSLVDKCLCKFFPLLLVCVSQMCIVYFNQCISVSFLSNPASVMGLCFKSLYQRDLLHSLAFPWTSLGNMLGVNVVFSIELINISALEEADSVRAFQDP